LLLEPPDGTANFLKDSLRAPTGRTPVLPLDFAASWPVRIGAFAGTVEEITTALDALFPKSLPIAAVVERRIDADGRDLRFAIEVESRESGSFRVAVLHDVHGHERYVFDGVTLSHYRDNQDPSISRRGTTMLLALWRALAQGVASTFDVSLRPQPGSLSNSIVLGGVARESGTGVMGIEVEIDRVLLARKDPRALRQVTVSDVDGVKHRFIVQATVGKIELSLFGRNRSG
jgi:hypothetical protein